MTTSHTHRLLVAALVAASATSFGQARPQAAKDSESFSGFSISLGASQVTQSGRTFLEEVYRDITIDTDTDNNSGGSDGSDTADGTYNVFQDNGGRLFESKDAFNGQLALAYNLAVGDSFLLGLEVAKQFGAGTRFTSLAGFSEADFEGVVETKNNWSVALRPAYALSNKFMVYGKISYANAKISGANSLLLADFYGVDNDGLSVSKNVSGLGLGVGFEYNIDQNWFLQFEIERIGFDSYRKSVSTGTNNTTVTDSTSTTPDSGASVGEYHSATADIGVNLSKATISLGYRF
ncbi:MAG: outer membrane protein [Opitutia bacterium]|jgi:opacity protein-like surface antigen